jgi:hypothetical protein
MRGGKVVVSNVPKALIEEAREAKAELVACCDQTPLPNGLQRAHALASCALALSQIERDLACGNEDAERCEELLLAFKAALIDSHEAASKWLSSYGNELIALLVRLLPDQYVYMEGAELSRYALKIFKGACILPSGYPERMWPYRKKGVAQRSS